MIWKLFSDDDDDGDDVDEDGNIKNITSVYVRISAQTPNNHIPLFLKNVGRGKPTDIIFWPSEFYVLLDTCICIEILYLK